MASGILWNKWFENPLRYPLPQGKSQKKELVAHVLRRLATGLSMEGSECHDVPPVEDLYRAGAAHLSEHTATSKVDWFFMDVALSDVEERIMPMIVEQYRATADSDFVRRREGHMLLLRRAASEAHAGLTVHEGARVRADVDVGAWRAVGVLLKVHRLKLYSIVPADLARGPVNELVKECTPELLAEDPNIESVLYD